MKLPNKKYKIIYIMLPKKFRLPPQDFDKVYHNGEKVRGRYGMFVYFENNVANPRFGFVLSKKIGGAVLRNRMTRLLRVVVMEVIKEFPIGSSSKSSIFSYRSLYICSSEFIKR